MTTDHNAEGGVGTGKGGGSDPAQTEATPWDNRSGDRPEDPPAPTSPDPIHCPACRIARELGEHRDAYYPPWSKVRAAYNFSAIVAARACPDYQPTSTEDGA